MPGKTQEVFVRKKYVSTYNVSIFPQVVTPLYDTFFDARPPCSKKVASKLVHRWGCTLSYKTRALLVLLSFRCVHVSRIIFPPMCTHTHRGPYVVTSLSRQEGRQKQRNQAIFAFSNPLLNEMYSLSPLSTSCAQAYIHVPQCYRKPPKAVFPYNNSLAVKIIFHSLLASTSPQTTCYILLGGSLSK